MGKHLIELAIAALKALQESNDENKRLIENDGSMRDEIVRLKKLVDPQARIRILEVKEFVWDEDEKVFYRGSGETRTTVEPSYFAEFILRLLGMGK